MFRLLVRPVLLVCVGHDLFEIGRTFFRLTLIFSARHAAWLSLVLIERGKCHVLGLLLRFCTTLVVDLGVSKTDGRIVER